MAMLSLDLCVPVASFGRRNGTPVRGATSTAAASPRLSAMSVAASYQMKLQSPLRCSSCGPQSNNHFHSDSPTCAAAGHHSTPQYKPRSLLFNHASMSCSSPQHNRLHQQQQQQQHYNQRHQHFQRWDAQPFFNSSPLAYRKFSQPLNAAELSPQHNNQRGRRPLSSMLMSPAASQVALRNSARSLSPEIALHHNFPKMIAEAKQRYLALGRSAFNEHRVRVRKELEDLAELDKSSNSPIALITVTKKPVLKSALQKRILGPNRPFKVSKGVRFSATSSVLSFSIHSPPKKLAPELQVRRMQPFNADNEAAVLTPPNQQQRTGTAVPHLSLNLPITKDPRNQLPYLSPRPCRSQNRKKRRTSAMQADAASDQTRLLTPAASFGAAAATSSTSQETALANRFALNFQLIELKGNNRKSKERRSFRARSASWFRSRSDPVKARKAATGWASSDFESGDEPEASKRRALARGRAGSFSTPQMMKIGISSVT